METKVKYQVIKVLHRIASKEQKLSDLVKHKSVVFYDVDEAIDYILENAGPGFDFTMSYHPVHENPYRYMAIGEYGQVNCDDFLLPDRKFRYGKV